MSSAWAQSCNVKENQKVNIDRNVFEILLVCIVDKLCWWRKMIKVDEMTHYENNCWMKSCTGENLLLNNHLSTKQVVDYMSCRRINRTLSLQSFGIVWQIKWKLEVHFPLCGVMKELIDSCATLRKRARASRARKGRTWSHKWCSVGQR